MKTRYTLQDTGSRVDSYGTNQPLRYMWMQQEPATTSQTRIRFDQISFHSPYINMFLKKKKLKQHLELCLISCKIS